MRTNSIDTTKNYHAMKNYRSMISMWNLSLSSNENFVCEWHLVDEELMIIVDLLTLVVLTNHSVNTVECWDVQMNGSIDIVRLVEYILNRTTERNISSG